MAITLTTGKVLWTHTYDSPHSGPNGVTVVAVAVDAATGRQLWSRTLTKSTHQGIDMAPGYDDGTVRGGEAAR
jgi:hypothetical protein